MNTLGWLTTGLNLAAFVACDAGCGNRAAKQEQAPPAGYSGVSIETTVKPLVVPEMDLPVKEGTMPLFYLVETTGGVRVVDQTTHHSLAQTTTPGRTIVSIDANHGVDIGGTVFTPGPLPDHRYAVYFYGGGFHPEQDIRTSTERNDPEILRPRDQLDRQDRGHSSGNGQGVSTTQPSPHQ